MTETSPKRNLRPLVPVLYLLSMLLLLATWSVASPVGSSPDERFHLASIYCSRGSSELCRPSSDRSQAEVPLIITDSPCFVRERGTDPLKSASCLNEVGLKDELLLSTTLINQDQYPPLFYNVMNLLATKNVKASVVSMRLVNSAVAVFLLGLVLLVASAHFRIGMVKSWFLLLFPLTAFTVASVNPSSWSITGIGTFWIFLAEFLSPNSKKPKWQIATGIALSSMIAVGSRTDSIFFLLISAISVGAWQLRLRRPRQFLPESRKLSLLIPALGVLAIVYLISQLSYMVNRFNPGQNPQMFSISLLTRNLLDLPMYFFGALGIWGRPNWPFGLGWFDIATPQVVPILTILMTGHLVFLNQNALTSRTKKIGTSYAVAAVVLILTPLQLSGTETDFFLQPRYLLPIAVPILGMLLSADQGNRVFPYRKTLLAVIFSLNGCISLYSVIARFAFNRDISANFVLNPFRDATEWWWDVTLNPGTLFSFGLLSTVLHGVTASYLISETSIELRGNMCTPEGSSTSN